MNYETASFGPGSTDRSKPTKKQHKRGDLVKAIHNQLADIAKKGSASPFERARIDSATNTAIAEVKMKAEALRRAARNK
jgi:hypothetical protein